MIYILETIAPVFLVILLGVFVRLMGFLPSDLAGLLNRLVYYLAIPALILNALLRAPFTALFDLTILAVTLVSVLTVFWAAVFLGRVLKAGRRQMGTFIQSSVHGNIGYIGFAIVFYYLGDEGFTRATIIAGFLILFQNFLSVMALQSFSGKKGGTSKLGMSFKTIVGNPVILATLAGITYNLSSLPVPETASRTLSIIAGMALPLALLVIGASLSFSLVKSQLRMVIASSCIKLAVLPATGLALFTSLGIATADFLPAFILLASPAATVTYVMAVEMDGSPDQATAAVSLSTLLSSFSYVAWLSVLA